MTGEEFDALVAPVRELLVKKGEDYNTAVKLEEYFPFGDKSYVQMLHVKVTRLRSLTQNERTPNFEGRMDTAKDLLSYTVFYLDYLEKKNATPV